MNAPHEGNAVQQYNIQPKEAVRATDSAEGEKKMDADGVACVNMKAIGYMFNEEGKLCFQDSGIGVEVDEAQEEQENCLSLLGAVKVDIEKILVERLGMKSVCLPDQNGREMNERQFYTNWDTRKNATGLIVLIEGFGTAGQWDPRLVLSDGLETGSQLPFIKKCCDNSWAVAVVDASCLCVRNEEAQVEEKGDGWMDDIDDCRYEVIEQNYCECERNCIRKCEADCLQKLLTLWRECILRSSFAKIALVAHHCGAFLAENILRQQMEKDRLKAVCLSDWTLYNAPKEEWWRYAIEITRHWVPSGRPFGAAEKTRYGVRCLSAGTRDPRMIPNAASDDMMRFIREQFGEEKLFGRVCGACT